MLKRFIAMLLMLVAISPGHAEEPRTDLHIYLFATGVEGDSQIANVTTDVDMGFDDILDNLDMGFMGYIEHKRGKWSYIGDIAYLSLSAENSRASDSILQVELDAEFTQTLFEGFVGYRVLEREIDTAELGLDLLLGIRHADLEFELSSQAALLGLTTSADRSRDENWTDAVLALRLQHSGRKGWGSMFWLDVGDGSDSSSKQFLALATYQNDTNWRFYGGYRYLNLEYETGSGLSKFAIDLDYTGPMFGVSYRMAQ
jgi:hypothetical protein